ncbi:hypothetical protein M2352_002245 [Azospirillum fermentarium]|uniref:hypothetical protein n=1 Tax=Azospirillum fermentarium TaxID=1233114 RepID=UPI002227EE3B|nr:hypothetical protein [Azospirillum fermentarium]MCW2246654.1 hypothetical protein [Azospirillum fermentarium]
MARFPFRWYKVYFVRPMPGARPGRPERDLYTETLRRFISENGLAGELNTIAPSAGFGIMEVHCTEKLASRLTDLSEVETVQER